MLHPKKVGTLPVAGFDATKQTNASGRFIPLLDGIDIQGKDSTADALLSNANWATYWVRRQVREVTLGITCHPPAQAKSGVPPAYLPVHIQKLR